MGSYIIKKSTKHSSLWAPFMLVTTEKMYWFWIPFLLVSYLGIIINFLNQNYEACFSSGSFYSTGITIIAPLCMELLIQNVVRKKKGETFNFVSYRSGILIISTLYIIFAAIFIGTKKTNSGPIQVFFGVITVIYSFYVYLVSKMEEHPNALKDFSDKNYADEENKAIRKMTQEAKDMKTFKTEDGRETKV